MIPGPLSTHICVSQLDFIDFLVVNENGKMLKAAWLIFLSPL